MAREQPSKRPVYGELTARQKAYAESYVNCFSKSQAAREAGFDETTGPQYAIEVHKKPQVVAYIRELLLQRRHKFEVTETKMQEEIRRIAFSDITLVYSQIKELEEGFKSNENGELEEGLNGGLTINDIKKLPASVRACIKAIKPTRFGITIEFYDKVHALEMLAKHFGYFEKDNKQKETAGVSIYLPDNGRGDRAAE